MQVNLIRIYEKRLKKILFQRFQSSFYTLVGVKRV